MQTDATVTFALRPLTFSCANAEMENVWRGISTQFGDLAFDASELAQRAVGFGVIAY